MKGNHLQRHFPLHPQQYKICRDSYCFKPFYFKIGCCIHLYNFPNWKVLGLNALLKIKNLSHQGWSLAALKYSGAGRPEPVPDGTEVLSDPRPPTSHLCQKSSLAQGQWDCNSPFLSCLQCSWPFSLIGCDLISIKGYLHSTPRSLLF